MKKSIARAAFGVLAVSLATIASAQVNTVPNESGKLAWYGGKFAGHKTASGERYAPEALTMAHNPKNNRSVTVRVNDRGPTQADRVGDVSLAAARKLGMLKSGVIDAELTVVSASQATKQ
jgi:rare lipoprotein A